MSTLAPPSPVLPQRPPFPVARFTVDQYHQMIRYGILGEDDAVELLAGWITPKMPRNPPHDATIDLAAEAIRRRLADEWRVRVQSAISINDSEPEPDLAVVPGPARRYAGQHPTPKDVVLVVEVAESSIDRDRDVKGPIYAGAGIPVYWIINLLDVRVEVYSRPSGMTYTQREDFSLPMAVPLVIDGQTVATIAVRDLLP